MRERTYTQEQLDIEVLKTQVSGMGVTFDRIDRRLDAIDSTLKSQYSSTMNHFLGIYAMILGAILAHVGGVF